VRLLAISDLHVDHPGQADALRTLPDHGDDWLIVAGDVADRPENVALGLRILTERFARVIWVPGNHELWSVGLGAPRGVARLEQVCDAARSAGAHTVEDGWIRWPGEGPPRAIVPLALLYDYTFGPEGLDAAATIAWAAEGGIRPADEILLHPDPFPSRASWCAARVDAAEALLATVPADHRTILVNHWTLRPDLVRLYRVPRYAPWCGTVRTADWHLRHRAEVVISGHLHMRATDWRDGVRFEEVSLGYPRDWDRTHGTVPFLREILPGPAPITGDAGPLWRRDGTPKPA
jgi:predicted phosphodiesterase